MKCSVCQREDRKVIEAEIEKGISYRKVAWRFRLGKGPVGRHAAHMHPSGIGQAQILRSIAEKAEEIAARAREALEAAQDRPGFAQEEPAISAQPPIAASLTAAEGGAMPPPLPALPARKATHPLFFQVLKVVQQRKGA